MRIRLVAILLLVATAIAAWQAESRAAQSQRLLLRSLVARLEPFGTLSYGTVTAHFWGAGAIEDLRFTPSAALKAQLDLPADFSAHLALLEYTDWQTGAIWPVRAHLRFDEATLPWVAPWPQTFQGRFDWQYGERSQEVRLGWSLQAAAAATLDGTLVLRLADPQKLAGATLLSGKLHYRDQGLAQGERAALAARLGADPQNAEVAFTELLTAWMTGHGLPPDNSSRETLRTFAREPLALTLLLDPPGELRPDTLGLFAPSDRLAALGFSLRNQ